MYKLYNLTCVEIIFDALKHKNDILPGRDSAHS